MKQQKPDEHVIGIVMDFPVPEVVEGVRSYCEEQGIFVDARWSVRGDWVISRPEWDGVIYRIADMKAEELRERVEAWDMQKVALARENDGAHVVSADYYQAGCMAADELLRLGTEQVDVFPLAPVSVDEYFCRGCHAQLQRHGVKSTLHQDFQMGGGLSSLVHRVAELVSTGSNRAVVMAHAGVMMDLQRNLLARGVRVPKDVAMVVLDKDIQQTAALSPVPVTAIQLDYWMQGYVAAEMLHKQLLKQVLDEPQVFITPKGVNQRESTGHLSELDKIVAKALGFIRQNYKQPMNVEDVASAVGASRRIVEQRFREVLDRGVAEEISRLRGERAKMMLQDDRYKVWEIAEQCGYSSLHYFSSAFKKLTGESPRAYRTRKKQEA